MLRWTGGIKLSGNRKRISAPSSWKTTKMTFALILLRLAEARTCSQPWIMESPKIRKGRFLYGVGLRRILPKSGQHVVPEKHPDAKGGYQSLCYLFHIWFVNCHVSSLLNNRLKKWTSSPIARHDLCKKAIPVISDCPRDKMRLFVMDPTMPNAMLKLMKLGVHEFDLEL